MKKYLIILSFLSLVSAGTSVQAASVDTVSIYSRAMHKSSKCVVILPESYKNNANRFPVVYLLHGYSGDYSNWIQKVPGLKSYVDEFQLIVVCPDGNYDSWYLDSPVDSTLRYETYIAEEVPHYIDSAYHTLAEKKDRAISGLSMGGQGALSIAWKHPEFFGAAGSMSGVQDLSPYKNGYDLKKILGDTLENALFAQNSVVNTVTEIPYASQALIIDCGVRDPFIKTNRQLHAELLERKIPHDYIERNGTHNWAYWSNAVGYQLLFFHTYFRRPPK
jgi:S-formylglutathione hydrolase FrmB